MFERTFIRVLEQLTYAKDETNCLVWVERMASILDMKIVQVLIRSKIVIFVV